MDFERLKAILEEKEGRIAHAYHDHKGYLTIGVGHLIDKRRGGGLPDHIIDDLLKHDIEESTMDLVRTIINWAVLPKHVKEALILMRFQLGLRGLTRFERMLEAIGRKDYQAAADEALNSKWARDDTPKRAQCVAALMRGD